MNSQVSDKMYFLSMQADGMIHIQYNLKMMYVHLKIEKQNKINEKV